MKRLFAMLTIVVFVLTACGEKKKTNNTSNTESSAQEEVIKETGTVVDSIEVSIEQAADDIQETTEKLDKALKELE